MKLYSMKLASCYALIVWNTQSKVLLIEPVSDLTGCPVFIFAKSDHPSWSPVWAYPSAPMTPGRTNPRDTCGHGTGPLGVLPRSAAAAVTATYHQGAPSARTFWAPAGQPPLPPFLDLGSGDRVGGSLMQNWLCVSISLAILSSAQPFMKQENQHKIQCGQHTPKPGGSLPLSCKAESEVPGQHTKMGAVRVPQCLFFILSCFSMGLSLLIPESLVTSHHLEGCLWTALPYCPPGIPRHPGHQASLLPPQALAQNSSSALQAQSWAQGPVVVGAGGRGASRLPSFRQPSHLTPNRHLTCPQSKHGFQKPAGNVLLPKTGEYPPGRERAAGTKHGAAPGDQPGAQVREQSQRRPMRMLRGAPQSATTAPPDSGLWDSGLRKCLRSGALRRTPVSRGPAGPGAGGWEGCPQTLRSRGGTTSPTRPLSKAKASR